MKYLTFNDIREILEISSDIDKWDFKKRNKVSDYVSSFFNKKTFNEYRKKNQPLLLKIEALNKPALSELCALIWIGRDYDYNESFNWESLIKESEPVKPEYVFDKNKLLSKYLLSGLKNLKIYKEYKNYCNEYEEKRFINSVAINEFGDELYEYLRKNPNVIYKFTPRKFEELINDILSRMGFKTELTRQTKDGGRDILAFLTTPTNQKLLTLIDCKRYTPENKIGIEQVERFLYVLDSKDDASLGMIVTTSSYSKDAKKIETLRPFRLQLNDFADIKNWLNIVGTNFGNNNLGLWLPKI